MPSIAGSMDRMKEPAAIPMSSTMVTRCAPKRSAMRPAGTPLSATTSGPTDRTSPTRAAAELGPARVEDAGQLRVEWIACGKSVRVLAFLPARQVGEHELALRDQR